MFKPGDPRARQAGQRGGGKQQGAGRPSRLATGVVPEGAPGDPDAEWIQCVDCLMLFKRPHGLGRKPIRCPDGCSGDPVEAMRNQILQKYDLNPAERALLEEACDTYSAILDLKARIRKEGVILDGRANPAQVELRQLRATFRQLVSALDFPE